MNSAEFRTAFHVNEKVGTYVPSNQYSLQNYRSQIEASAWIYDMFALYGYRMMHIMADTDGIVSLPGAWKWIKDRNFKI